MAQTPSPSTFWPIHGHRRHAAEQCDDRQPASKRQRHRRSVHGMRPYTAKTGFTGTDNSAIPCDTAPAARQRWRAVSRRWRRRLGRYGRHEPRHDFRARQRQRPGRQQPHSMRSVTQLSGPAHGQSPWIRARMASLTSRPAISPAPTASSTWSPTTLEQPRNGHVFIRVNRPVASDDFATTHGATRGDRGSENDPTRTGTSTSTIPAA